MEGLKEGLKGLRGSGVVEWGLARAKGMRRVLRARVRRARKKGVAM